MSNKLFLASSISSSALRASRTWMNSISNNLANAHSVDTGVRGKDGNLTPYARQVPVFQRVLSESFRRNRVNGDVTGGVAVKGVATLKDDVKKVYDPTHPAARKAGTVDAGYVYYPAISVPQEIADMRIATAAYEANLTAISVSKRMSEMALSIGRR